MSEHEVIEAGGFTVMGLETRASNDRPDLLGEFWGAFLGRGEASQSLTRAGIEPLDTDVIAVYTSYDGDHTQPYTFLLGFRVSTEAKTPEGLVRYDVPGGRYARFVAVGEQPRALIETWGAILGLELEREYALDYEVHHELAGEPTDQRRVDVFVGVR